MKQSSLLSFFTGSSMHKIEHYLFIGTMHVVGGVQRLAPFADENGKNAASISKVFKSMFADYFMNCYLFDQKNPTKYFCWKIDALKPCAFHSWLAFRIEEGKSTCKTCYNLSCILWNIPRSLCEYWFELSVFYVAAIFYWLKKVRRLVTRWTFVWKKSIFNNKTGFYKS